MTTDLYDAAIVAEAKAKVGAARLDHPTVSVTADNPLCGDRVTLDLAITDGRITAVGHKTRGCLLCQAASSLIARHAVGAETAGLKGLRSRVAGVLKDGAVPPWAELSMFAPVGPVRSRHECVLLPFQALEDALSDQGSPG